MIRDGAVVKRQIGLAKKSDLVDWMR